MEQCYHEHYRLVDGAVGAVLRGPDREHMVHEVFYKLVSDERARRGFTGGSLGAWLCRVARNLTIDHVRRRSHEHAVNPEDLNQIPDSSGDQEARAAAREVLEIFRRDIVPVKWRDVFDARFLDQLTQEQSAERLGIGRTTLAYRELRIRHLLRRFVLEEGGSL